MGSDPRDGAAEDQRYLCAESTFSELHLVLGYLSHETFCHYIWHQVVVFLEPPHFPYADLDVCELLRSRR